MSDPGKYRTRDEIQKIRAEHDCIDLLRARLAEAGVRDGELKSIDQDVKRTIEDAVVFAQDSPEPDPSALYTDVLLES